MDFKKRHYTFIANYCLLLSLSSNFFPEHLWQMIVSNNITE